MVHFNAKPKHLEIIEMIVCLKCTVYIMPKSKKKKQFYINEENISNKLLHPSSDTFWLEIEISIAIAIAFDVCVRACHF